VNNKYGLDCDYFEKKLKLIVRDACNYTPAEMARELARISISADSNVIFTEKEFNQKLTVDKIEEIALKSFDCEVDFNIFMTLIKEEAGKNTVINLTFDPSQLSMDCNVPQTRDNDSILRDAERYNFLRSADLDKIKKGCLFAVMPKDGWLLNGHDLDFAIDIAIKKNKEK